MIVDRHLYIGQMKDSDVVRTVRKLKKNKPCAGVFVVTLPLFDQGILEIYDANELTQKYYRERTDEIHVVGISHTRHGAVTLVRDIISDIYDKTGDFDCTDYFMQGE